MNIQKIKTTALALAFLAQPISIRADGNDDMWNKIIGTVVVVGGLAAVAKGIQILNAPPSDESLSQSAQKQESYHRPLVQDLSAKNYSSSEADLRLFAGKHINGSVLSSKNRVEEDLKNVRALRKMLINRKDSDDCTMRADLQHRAAVLYEIECALQKAQTYLNTYTNYFELLAAIQQGTNVIGRGCAGFYGSYPATDCAAAFKNTMDDLNAKMNKSGVYWTNLYAEAKNVSNQLLQNRASIINSDAYNNELRARERLIAQQEEKIRQQEREKKQRDLLEQQRKAEKYQRELEQAIQASYAQQKQEQQKREQEKREKEARDLERAKQESLKTYAQEQERKKQDLERQRERNRNGIHKDCTPYACMAQDGSRPMHCPVYHQDCPADKCLRTLSLEDCLRYRPAISIEDAHERCKYYICYLKKDAECPAVKAHKDCDAVWCRHYKDSQCPRFHERS